MRETSDSGILRIMSNETNMPPAIQTCPFKSVGITAVQSRKTNTVAHAHGRNLSSVRYSVRWRIVGICFRLSRESRGVLTLRSRWELSAWVLEGTACDSAEPDRQGPPLAPDSVFVYS